MTLTPSCALYVANIDGLLVYAMACRVVEKTYIFRKGSLMNKSRQKSTIALIGASAMALGLAACGNGDAGADGDLQDSYVVVSDTSFVPFAFEEGGEFVGFDMDIINTVADRVGFEIDLETTNFDGIIPGLQTGSFEIAIAGIGITEERAESTDYTSPY